VDYVQHIQNYDDVEWGLAIQYFENENIKSISSWDYGILENQYISFFPDGSIEEKAYFKDGKFQGQRINFFESGGIKILRKYTNGMLDGESTLFYPNYQKKVSIFYEKNYKEGKALAFYANGQIAEEAIFINDTLSGQILFHDSAQSKVNQESNIILSSIVTIEK